MLLNSVGYSQRLCHRGLRALRKMADLTFWFSRMMPVYKGVAASS
jgi:hypothetical protein